MFEYVLGGYLLGALPILVAGLIPGGRRPARMIALALICRWSAF